MERVWGLHSSRELEFHTMRFPKGLELELGMWVSEPQMGEGRWLNEQQAGLLSWTPTTPWMCRAGWRPSLP